MEKTEKRTDEEIYKHVVAHTGNHKDLPLHINATGEYLRKDIVLITMHEYAAQEVADYKAKLRAKVMDISKYDEDLKMKVIELIDKL